MNTHIKSNLLIVSIVLICLMPLKINYSQTLIARDVFNKVVHSVVKVYAFDFWGIEFSMGSGVVIDKNTIATNYHVFNGCEKLEVEHFGKRYSEVKILLAEPEIDILILLVNDLNLEPIEIADSNDIIIGDKIYAIGSPKGFENTITDGIISGIRQMNESIQISAGITYGSSGGAVVNDKGKLIGISTSGYEATNINFAIPSSYLLNKSNWCNKEDLNCLKKTAKFCKAYNLTTLTERILKFISDYDYSDKLDSAIDNIRQALEVDPKQQRAKDLVYYITKRFPFHSLDLKHLKELQPYMGAGFEKFLEGIEIFENHKGSFNAYNRLIDAINLEPQNKNYYYFLGLYYGQKGLPDFAIINMIKAYRLGDFDAQEWLYSIGFSSY